MRDIIQEVVCSTHTTNRSSLVQLLLFNHIYKPLEYRNSLTSSPLLRTTQVGVQFLSRAYVDRNIDVMRHHIRRHTLTV